MSGYREFNPNPFGARRGDCTVRAITKALGISWHDAYWGICEEGAELADMPDANHVWGSYLQRNGFRRATLPNTCPACYTVRDFCRDHPTGTFLLAIDGHVVTVVDGFYYDTWDSGDCVPLYYWFKE